MFPSGRQKIFSVCVFTVYLILLTWLILFKFAADFTALSSMRSLNLIPFGDSITVNKSIGLREIVFNMLVFIPFGVYLEIFLPDFNAWKKTGIGLLLSIGYEAVQFLFAIGASDITDVLMNTLGCVVGVFAGRILRRILKGRFIPAVNVLGSVIGGCVLALMLVLNIAN